MSTLTFVTTLGEFIKEREDLLESLSTRLRENTTRISELRTIHDKLANEFELDYTNHLERYSSDIIKILKREAIEQLISKNSNNSLFGKVLVNLGSLLGDRTYFIRHQRYSLEEELYKICSFQYAAIDDIQKIETISDFLDIDSNSYKYLMEYKFRNFNNFLLKWGIPTIDIDSPISKIRELRSDIKECEGEIKELLCEIDKITADIKAFNIPRYYENECTVSLDSTGNCSVDIK
jgi:ribosomal protein S20